MARSAKQLANLRPVKKGDPPLNPEGARAHNPQLRAFKRLTAIEIAEIGSIILQNDISVLRELNKDPKVSALKKIIISVALKAYEQGDVTRLDVLLNRFVGRVKETVEITGKDGESIKINQYTDDELEAKLNKINSKMLLPPT